jgi:F-box/leucine-rich repeat protein 10/11
LNDAALHKLLTTPRDSRPGLLDKKSRLKNLKKLSLKNTEVSDISLRYIPQYLPQLTCLAAGSCLMLA